MKTARLLIEYNNGEQEQLIIDETAFDTARYQAYVRQIGQGRVVAIVRRKSFEPPDYDAFDAY